MEQPKQYRAWLLGYTRRLPASVVWSLQFIVYGLVWVVVYILTGWGGVVIIAASILTTEYLNARRERKRADETS